MDIHIIANCKSYFLRQVAREAGLSRESLYKALSGEPSPGFDTILNVMMARGIQLHAEPARPEPVPGSPVSRPARLLLTDYRPLPTVYSLSSPSPLFSPQKKVWFIIDYVNPGFTF